jgi:ketosteroid isomerase-like protein
MTHYLPELQRLNARFIHNFITNDVAAHDAILHPAFTYISGSGRRVDRATYLQEWATGFDANVLPYWDTRDERIVQRGDVALVSAINKYIEQRNGVAHTAMAAYTDTYVREGGRWLCLQAQITPVAEAHWPSDASVVNVYLKGVLQVGVNAGG